jgi:hypothetical protein
MAQAFQRMMDTMLAGLPFIFVYIDDILSPKLWTQKAMLILS